MSLILTSAQELEQIEKIYIVSLPFFERETEVTLGQSNIAVKSFTCLEFKNKFKERRRCDLSQF